MEQNIAIKNLIENFVEKGIDWRYGASTLGIDISIASDAVKRHRDNKLLLWRDDKSNILEEKIMMLANNITEEKVSNAKLLETIQGMKHLNDMIRLENNLSTDNVALLWRKKNEQDDDIANLDKEIARLEAISAKEADG